MRLYITELNYYPVKSCRGISVQEAFLERQGLRHDRRWMIVRPDGQFLSQRVLPRMALVETAIEDPWLRLRAPGATDLHIPLKIGGAGMMVQIWNDACEVVDCGEDAAVWLRKFLGQDCRLVFMPEDYVRPVSGAYAAPGDQVGFADAFPLLLTSESSLAELNSRLACPVPMNRFRPNIVVAGAPAFAEDSWRRMVLPERGLTFRVAKPCARCVITTVDQQQGRKESEEPLRTLATFRTRNDHQRGIMFGQNLVHEWPGKPSSLAVGDSVGIFTG